MKRGKPAKKAKGIGYTVSKTRPDIRGMDKFRIREFWFRSGWGIPESLKEDNWSSQPSFNDIMDFGGVRDDYHWEFVNDSRRMR